MRFLRRLVSTALDRPRVLRAAIFWIAAVLLLAISLGGLLGVGGTILYGTPAGCPEARAERYREAQP